MKPAVYVLGIATGLVVAQAPTANGLVLLLGGFVGVVLTVTVVLEREHRRRDDADIAVWRRATSQTRNYEVNQ